MADMWISEAWHPALKCARQSIQWGLRVGVSLPEIVDWFYDDTTAPGSDEWDDIVLRARWDTYTWRGVFQAWDECGRPEYDPGRWCGDDRDPELRRAAQGNARLDAVGELVFQQYPAALEQAARDLGWEVRFGLDFPDGVFPEGAIALDEGGLEAAAGDDWITVLVPPAVGAAA
mgnify:CR=1 FL=1